MRRWFCHIFQGFFVPFSFFFLLNEGEFIHSFISFIDEEGISIEGRRKCLIGAFFFISLNPTPETTTTATNQPTNQASEDKMWWSVISSWEDGKGGVQEQQK